MLLNSNLQNPLWNSANASRKNNSVWRSNHSDLGFVFDSEENPLVPPRLGPFSWTATSKIPSQTQAHIDVAFSNDHRLCDSLSFHGFHGEICSLFEQQNLTQNGSETCDFPIVTPCISRAKHINVRTFSFTILMPLSACPADLLSYAGLALCIVLTPASLSVEPTLRLNATIELSPSVRTITLG